MCGEATPKDKQQEKRTAWNSTLRPSRLKHRNEERRPSGKELQAMHEFHALGTPGYCSHCGVYIRKVEPHNIDHKGGSKNINGKRYDKSSMRLLCGWQEWVDTPQPGCHELATNPDPALWEQRKDKFK